MGYLRLVAPLREAGIEMILGVENGEIKPERVLDGDLVVIQRHLPVHFKEYKKIISLARSEKKPIVFELDDLLFFLPDNHPDRLIHFYSGALLPVFQALLEADLITVPTEELRSVLSRYVPADKIAVLPNLLDDKLWSLRDPKKTHHDNDVITIGYMGTESHRPDIVQIVPALIDILQQFPEKVTIQFWGIQRPEELSQFSQVQWTPWISYNYPEFAQHFQTQRADIFIAPLVDNLFNRCKSALKFFEYSALGVCGIYSAIPPYNKVIRHGEQGLLASSISEWVTCLRQLIEDESLRLRLAQNALLLIQSQYVLSQQAYRWREVYQSIIEQSASGATRNSTWEIVDTINSQLFDLLASQYRRITEQEQRITEQEQNIVDLEQEILHYVMSRSWRYTRFFRKVNEKISKLLV